jgi:hypothetical protein
MTKFNPPLPSATPPKSALKKPSVSNIFQGSGPNNRQVQIMDESGGISATRPPTYSNISQRRQSLTTPIRKFSRTSIEVSTPPTTPPPPIPVVIEVTEETHSALDRRSSQGTIVPPNVGDSMESLTSPLTPFPFTPMTPYNPSEATIADTSNSNVDDTTVCEVIEPWFPQRFDELRLEPGMRIIVLKTYEDGWCEGRIEGSSEDETGVFPLACVIGPIQNEENRV